MMNGRGIVRLRQWLPLRIGDRYHRDIMEKPVQGPEFRKIEAPVQGGYRGHPEQAQCREGKIIQVTMNDVELMGAARNRFELHEQRRHRIVYRRIETQCTRPNGGELRLGATVTGS